MPDGTLAATIVLLGFVGTQNWRDFSASPEAADGKADPLDRWSRRVIDQLAQSLGALALYPFPADRPPYLPFQRWAQRAEPVHVSPVKILIHPNWGLWHSYRGALCLRERLTLPARDARATPCASCAARPCLTACPVDAFAGDAFSVARCADHIASPAGRDCLDLGCRARRACPVAPEHRYGREQAGFHMRAFLRQLNTS